MCVIFKHFYYLCTDKINNCLVTFAVNQDLRVLFSTASNVTCASREAVCIEPRFLQYERRLY